MLERVCCMKLHTYGMVIGWLGAIQSFFVTIILAGILGFSDQLFHNPSDPNKKSGK